MTGLVFAGGLAAGPALANELGVESKPAAPVVQTDTKADAKAGKAGEAVGVVDRAKLLPHGVPSGQSRIDLGAEQTGNVKEIVAA
ncbi:hypothetical protein GSF22_34275, partial [Micromonospora echinofusca]|nr:hypothetical protein [Micromonospora echinofusca]